MLTTQGDKKQGEIIRFIMFLRCQKKNHPNNILFLLTPIYGKSKPSLHANWFRSCAVIYLSYRLISTMD